MRPQTIVNRILLVLSTLLSTVLAHVSSPPTDATTAASPAEQTVVSLTFDDGNDNQKQAADILTKARMPGTFYVPSGLIDSPGHLSLSNLRAMAAAGHEIGGHTIHHPDLTAVSSAEATRQICDDRAALVTWGFFVRSFAYPYARSNAAVERTAEECGYNSARLLGGLERPGGACPGCGHAETLPPTDPYATRAPDQVDNDWTLADLQGVVKRAERTGGWVQITFHNICTSGCQISVTPTILKQFVRWLGPRHKLGTVVRSVGDAVGGPSRPVVRGPAREPLAPGENGVANPGMEQIGPDGTPTCWMRGGYGSNSALHGTSEGRAGRGASVRVTDHVDGDAKWLPTFDMGDCAPPVMAGRSYSVRSWYTSTVPTQFAVYLRDARGAWHYWTSSPWFPATERFTQAVWRTPRIPDGSTAISAGLNLFSDGTLVTDDHELYDSIGAPPADAPPIDTPSSTTPRIAGAVDAMIP
ncbi:polysaccharide deacetylase family protein [Aeromicrobium sp. CTD01-1L150]|uniref:polysaccharide deacetylase family protein n=1 Tax=Aeromicrobium sp. CTD01-1L150 TaxID=3341830 RepID=UPI0035BF0543